MRYLLSEERCNKAHWNPVFFTNSPKVLHSITQNPYLPNPMHYLQLSFLDPSSLGTAVIKELVSATFMTPFW
ncbi:hypothetical protein [Wolbachia sp. wLmal]|uniref:hypothetical protein n=1 Tax=Wolbachia sp. wLmal TaxID=3342489 RepID=UPI003C3085B4